MKAKNNPDDFPSEDALVSYLKQKIPRFGAMVGIGDDAAVISNTGSQLVVTTDSLVENIHFKRDWVTPLYLGKKAGRANLSDIAAMGAEPTQVLVSLILPKAWYRKSVISELYDGLLWALSPHKTEIIGGNVSSGINIVITLTVIGVSHGKPLLRSGAAAGDSIFCTGTLGKAAMEVKALLTKKKKHMELVPPDRILFARELVIQDIATSCMDISDGLALDLSRLCRESNVGAHIVAGMLPVDKNNKGGKNVLQNALYGGEEYELLFTVPKVKREIMLTVARKLATPVAEIGVIKQTKNLGLVLEDGSSCPLVVRGWDHVGKFL